MHPAFQGTQPNKLSTEDNNRNNMEMKQYNMETTNASLHDHNNKINNLEKPSMNQNHRRNSLEEYNGDKNNESDESDEEIDLTTGGGCIDYSNNNKN
jgi:hypothetical protein